jgi:hypothetical protein
MTKSIEKTRNARQNLHGFTAHFSRLHYSETRPSGRGHCAWQHWPASSTHFHVSGRPDMMLAKWALGKPKQLFEQVFTAVIPKPLARTPKKRIYSFNSGVARLIHPFHGQKLNVINLIHPSNTVDIEAANLEPGDQCPLSEKGREKIKNIACALKALGVKPDLVVSSPYVRAEQSARIMR